MQQSQLEQIELTLENANLMIKRKKMLTKLIATKEWKELIDEGYLKDEAVRLVYLKADTSMAEEAQQAHILRAIDSIGVLRGYIYKVFTDGRQAEGALEDHENTREALLAEELVGDQ